MLTATQLFAAVGKPVRAQFEKLQIDCVIRDAKQAYGNTRVLLEPILGQGSQWVDATRIVRLLDAADIQPRIATLQVRTNVG